MFILFLFGVLHLLLFWMGDILATYALLGLLVLPLLQLSDKKIVTIGLLFILFRPLYYLGVVGFDWPMVPVEKPVSLEQFISVFQQGSFFEIFKLRMLEFVSFQPENLVWYLPKTFGCFLIGIYAAGKNLFASIKENHKKYLTYTFLLLLVSCIWIYFKMDFFNRIDLKAAPLWRPFLIGINVLFETALGIGYIFGFTILFQKSNFLSQILAKCGRLALSNYILQSLICVLIFYGYGLAHYGTLRPTDLVLLSAAIFGFNVAFSHFYLKYRPSGPLEYLWRKLINFKK